MKFSDLNDSEIAEITKLPGPSLSQIRRRLIEDGFLKIVNIPNIARLNFELLTLTHTKFNPSISSDILQKAMEYMKESPSCTFIIAGGIEACTIDVHKDYTEYEIKHNKDIKFYKENKIITEDPVNSILPLQQVQFEKLNFTPLVSKVLNLNVDF